MDSEYFAAQAADFVSRAADANDRVIVIDAKVNEARWYNLADNVAKHIQSRWNP